MALREEIFERAKKAIIALDETMAKEVAAQGLDEKINPFELINNGFVPGINEVGELFNRGALFLPELVMAAGVMQQVTEYLKPSLTAEEQMKKPGIVVMGTVQGDIHDIGKTIVVAFFDASGFEVHDLGRDVPTERFIEEAQKVNADIIGTSALLTTTMPVQRNLEEALKKAGLKGRCKTIVGGAPVTQRWADRIGADAYAQDAAEGVKKAKQLLGLA